VINLRGKVIPVVDLRLKFGMERCQATEQTVIIVVQYAVEGKPPGPWGSWWDQVLEVLNIGARPDRGSAALRHRNLRHGLHPRVGKSEKRVIFLLDIGRVLNDAETKGLSRKWKPALRNSTGASAPPHGRAFRPASCAPERRIESCL